MKNIIRRPEAMRTRR